MQNAKGGALQFLGIDLKQLVPRIGLQDVQQCLTVVTRWRETCQLQHLIDLALKLRDLPRTLTVGRGRKEADEQAFAADPVLAVEQLDRDGVDVGVAMDCGASVGLGDAQQFRRLHPVLNVGW